MSSEIINDSPKNNYISITNFKQCMYNIEVGLNSGIVYYYYYLLLL